MSKPTRNARVEELVGKLNAANERATSIAKDLDRLRKALRKGCDALTKLTWPFKALEDLQRSLRQSGELPGFGDVKELGDLAESVLESLARAFAQQFRKDLAASADAMGIACETSCGESTVGPFDLIVDRHKSIATLMYAKAALLPGLPLDAETIVGTAKRLTDELLNLPINLEQLAAQFAEAVVVTVAREKKSTRAPELRADLPTVHREMVFIRQDAKHPATRKTFLDYPLARFVVELASLVRSDANLSSDKSFRLETAVIENTGNPRKSVFIPKDLAKGYGEGTYYQAILLRQPG